MFSRTTDNTSKLNSLTITAVYFVYLLHLTSAFFVEIKANYIVLRTIQRGRGRECNQWNAYNEQCNKNTDKEQWNKMYTIP